MERRVREGVGFLYEGEHEQQAVGQAEAELLKAELTGLKAEIAGARLCRNILASRVRQLLERRRALHTEVCEVESEHNARVLMMRRIDGYGAESGADAGDSPDSRASRLLEDGRSGLRLLDEAEARHAALLAQRRRDHLAAVGGLQKEYISALYTFKGEEEAVSGAGGAAHSPHPPRSPGAGLSSTLSPHKGGARSFAAADAPTPTGLYTGGGGGGGGEAGEPHPQRLHRELQALEAQLQRQRSRLAAGQERIAAAQSEAASMREAAAAAPGILNSWQKERRSNFAKIDSALL